MTVIVCLDDKNGMMFDGRRQSKDSVLRQRILTLANGNKLWMNEYSKKQFEEAFDKILVDENFLSQAASGDFCFVEDKPLFSVLERIEKLIVYRWNRVYPSDMKLDIPLDSFTLQSTFEFKGSSHEKISEEVYVK